MHFYSINPKSLLLISLFCTVYGILLIKRGYEGDTLLPGTNFSYLPRWLFFVVGSILLIPLPLAVVFLKSQGQL